MRALTYLVLIASIAASGTPLVAQVVLVADETTGCFHADVRAYEWRRDGEVYRYGEREISVEAGAMSGPAVFLPHLIGASGMTPTERLEHHGVAGLLEAS